MKRTAVYPFTAIVGQEEMKLSLILNVINPALGGVLIKGEKGTAKSTAVRALAELLPPMRVELLSDRQAVVDGCRGILEYNECCIRLCTGAVTVRFTGEGLQMRNFGSLGAVVEGRIRSVEFV